MAGNTAIVLAAGSGKRMNSTVAKQYLMLKDKPVIWYALKTFEESLVVDNVILVVGSGEVEYCSKHIVEKYGFAKVRAVIEGGAERYLSVWEGLKWIAEHLDEEGQGIVFIRMFCNPFQTFPHRQVSLGTAFYYCPHLSETIFLHNMLIAVLHLSASDY